MSSDRKAKKYPRDVFGLRDALFDELEDLRAGASAPHEVLAVCSLAERVLDTFDAQMKREAFDLTCKEREKVLARATRPTQLTYSGGSNGQA